jgi:hypothetical protein
MSRKDVQDRNTLILIKEFITNSQSLRTYQEVPPEKTKRWWRKKVLKWKKDGLHKKLRQILDVLTARYEGVLYQMLRHSGVSAGALKSTVTAVWVSCQDKILTLSDYREFSAVLWEAYVSVSPVDARTLRPRFMLRQIVDEMPSSDERGVLIYRAYDKASSIDPPGKEVLAKLNKAYEMLHLELLKQGDDLEILTGGEIALKDIENFKAPFVHYEEWLFPE